MRLEKVTAGAESDVWVEVTVAPAAAEHLQARRAAGVALADLALPDVILE